MSWTGTALPFLTAALILLLLAAVHLYLYRRVVEDVSRAGSPWRRVGAVLVGLSAAATVSLLLAGPAEPPFEVARLLTVTGDIWLPLLAYLTGALLLGELLRPLLRRLLDRRAAAPSPLPAGGEGLPLTDGGASSTRRIFVARGVAIGAAAFAAAGTAAGASGEPSGQRPGARAVELALPFTGLWRVRNSPARRIPSHGTDLFGSSHAVDFLGVDERHRTAGSRSWRTFFATEPPELFVSFGRPVLAPGDGIVVAAHDGEPDHEARRSQAALVPYMLGQAARVRRGVNAIAGNHVVIALSGEGGKGAYVALVHLRSGSVRVSEGQRVVTGQQLADCGNSGNSTQPHVHMQVMDSSDLSVARGLPMLFRRFREWPSGPKDSRMRDLAVPGEEAVIESFTAPRSG
ncbi:M23 family metallopeptidase [Streptomyces sp. NPDC006516]|uniref:M23 family metallopeptidase n=1 Tax=Streptomyces sp. NPDC006516 TaxID=3154309 RepID=UPI0033A81499